MVMATLVEEQVFVGSSDRQSSLSMLQLRLLHSGMTHWHSGADNIFLAEDSTGNVTSILISLLALLSISGLPHNLLLEGSSLP